MRKLILLAIGIVLLISASLAQDTNYARRIIRNLSSPSMYGRGSAHKGDSIAASFIRSELYRHNVKELGNRYFQSFTYNTCSMEGQCWIDLNGRRLKNYEEFRVAPWSNSLVRPSIEVFNIPFNILLDKKKLQSFIAKHQGSISDALVYIDASGIEQMEDQEKKAARNILNELKRRNPFGSKGIMIGLNTLNTYSVSSCDRQRNYTYIELLTSSMPKRVKNLNICINIQYHPQYQTQNVCGMIPGETDTMIVFTAHYDHLGMMGEGYKYQEDNEIKQDGAIIFPGAHDNASGVAAVLDIARIYTYEKPHYSLVFFFLAGEEVGLKGSSYAAKHPLIDFSKVKLLVNLDMWCGGDEGLMVFNAKSKETKPYFNKLKTLNDAIQVAPEIRPRHNSPNSDHYPFSSLCPSIYILTMGHPYGGYHDPYDTCEACGLGNYYNYLLLVTSLLMN